MVGKYNFENLVHRYPRLLLRNSVYCFHRDFVLCIPNNRRDRIIFCFIFIMFCTVQTAIKYT